MSILYPLESLQEHLGTLDHLDKWRLRAYLHQECQTKQRDKKDEVYSFEKGQLLLLCDALHELFPR